MGCIELNLYNERNLFLGLIFNFIVMKHLLIIAIISWFSFEVIGQGQNSMITNPKGNNGSVRQTEIYLTAKETSDKLTLKGTFQFKDASNPDESIPSIFIDNLKTFQEIVGIGGALTDASAETFYKLPKDKQEMILNAYFDPINGIGYTLARTHIHSCDFSSESYTYTPHDGDKKLSDFSVEHDMKYRIPLIKAAIQKSNNELKLFASPWSPPAWMKTNNDMLHGGKLKPEFADTWAKYYIEFFKAYQKEGIHFWGLTVQNEPAATQTWESCIYTAEDERDFVRDHLGPCLKASEFSGLKLMVWDHNRNIMYPRAATVLEDSLASKYVWGVAFHWYSGNNFENVASVHEAFPDKGLLFSEGCVFPFSIDKINDWNWGEQYGESMINDFRHNAMGWTDWNILVDEKGGPNHVQNYCYAPVVGDTRDGKVYFMNSYYYIGHFSKFIRPGAKRIACTPNTDDMMAVSFQNADKSIATVIMNKTDRKIQFNLCFENKAMHLELPAHSIMTAITH